MFCRWQDLQPGSDDTLPHNLSKTFFFFFFPTVYIFKTEKVWALSIVSSPQRPPVAKMCKGCLQQSSLSVQFNSVLFTVLA